MYIRINIYVYIFARQPWPGRKPLRSPQRMTGFLRVLSRECMYSSSLRSHTWASVGGLAFIILDKTRLVCNAGNNAMSSRAGGLGLAVDGAV